MKTHFSPTAQQWRLVALLICILMLLSMAVPGSFVEGYYYDGGFELNSGSYFAPCSWAMYFSFNCILLGIIALGCCIWSLARKTNVFFSLLAVNAVNLCIFAWVLRWNNTEGLLRMGINISFVFVPPILSALMPVAAFLARKAEKKE